MAIKHKSKFYHESGAYLLGQLGFICLGSIPWLSAMNATNFLRKYMNLLTFMVIFRTTTLVYYEISTIKARF